MMNHHVYPVRHAPWQLVAILPFLAGACGSKSDAGVADGGDTAASPPTSAAPSGSVAAAAPGSTAANASPDADQAFLRAMIDNEWGLIVLAHVTLEREKGGAVRDEAAELDKSHGREIDRLYAALRGISHDDYAGKLTPEDSAAIDSLARFGGTTYDRAFRQAAITQVQHSIVLTDRYLPVIRSAEARTLAERLRAIHQREIEAFMER